jgi:LCP family protein required for cell wall assembly
MSSDITPTIPSTPSESKGPKKSPARKKKIPAPQAGISTTPPTKPKKKKAPAKKRVPTKKAPVEKTSTTADKAPTAPPQDIPLVVAMSSTLPASGTPPQQGVATDQNPKAPTPTTLTPVRPKTRLRRALGRLGKLFIFFCILAIVSGAVFAYQLAFSDESGFFKGEESIFRQVTKLVIDAVSDEAEKIKGEENDRINILLIGYGGAGHPGAYLADTIILASIQPSTNQAALLSIPRDLFVPIRENQYRKINNAFTFGRTKDDPEGGAKLMISVVENITGQTIPYYIHMDFTGFEKAIDKIGGIEVDVQCGFIDRGYPTTNYGYQTIRFDQGVQKLNGDLALKYVRSRHGVVTSRDCPSEGSDFARSRRQQQVITATRDKVFSTGTFARPQRIVGLLSELGRHASTNMSLPEFTRLLELSKKADASAITTITLDATDLIYGTRSADGASILRPKAGAADFSEIYALSEQIFNTNQDEQRPTLALIQGGANGPNPLPRLQQQLRAIGYTAKSLPKNDTLSGYEKTVIYDLSEGKHPVGLSALRTRLDANVAPELTPAISALPIAAGTDFIIVTGNP